MSKYCTHYVTLVKIENFISAFLFLDSGKKVTGFELRIAPNSGPFIGKVECVVFNMEKANWTDADIVSKVQSGFVVSDIQ